MASTAAASRHAAEAAEGAEFVFTCVGNDDDLRAGRCSATTARFAGMESGAIFVDHTTASADVARELDAAAEKRGASASSTRRCPAARPARRTASSP